MADKEAVRATMDRVIAADAQHLWQQGDWIAAVDSDGDVVPHDMLVNGEYCGTAGCFAGHYCFSQGFTDVDWTYGTVANLETGQVLDFDREDMFETDNVSGYARAGMELTGQEAIRLFNADNTLEQLKAITDWVCDR